MKKMSKILAVLLSAIIFMSAFSIVSSAVTIGPSSNKDTLLKYHDERLAAISKQYNVVKTENKTVLSVSPDVSGLSDRDANATLRDIAFEDLYEGAIYFHGDSEKDYYFNGKSELFYALSINRQIKEFGLKYKSSKCSADKSGNNTVTLVYLENFEDIETTITYTIKYDKSGNILSYRCKQVSTYIGSSAYGNDVKITETVDDSYSFSYKKTSVKSVSLSESDVTVRLGNEYVITANVTPDNASYKDVYIGEYDPAVVECYVNDNGEIVINAVGKGTTEIEIFTYDLNKKAVCNVTVEATFFDLVIQFFRTIFDFLFGWLAF